MRKILLTVTALSIFLFNSCHKEVNMDESMAESLNIDIAPMSITNPNDPNLDPNWNYADPNTTTAQIYYGQRIGGQPVSSTETLLPWFTAGNPINNDDYDYRPELGWVLYLKDFGTPERPAQTPFFALYNKYSGVIRFFVYNYRVRNLGEQSKTYYVAELKFNSLSDYNASLSFFAEENKFVKSKTDPSTKQTVVTKKNVSDTWLNFDFVMVHDTKKSELLLNVYGANQTDLSLGTDFSTLTARSSVGASTSNSSNFSNSIEKGYEYFSSTHSLFEAIDKFNEKKNQPKTNSLVIDDNAHQTISPNSISIGTVTAAIGVVKTGIGLIKSFFGGKKSTSATQTTIQYDGIVKTTGTANITNHLYSINLHQDPNVPLTANRYRPIYNGRTGLLGAPENFYLTAAQHFYPNCFVEYKSDYMYFYNFNTRFVYDTILGGFNQNSDFIGKIQVSKFEAYIVNNVLAEKGYFSRDDAPDYNTFRRHNSLKFLEDTPESINDGVGFNTLHTPPKNLLHTLDNDEVRIEFGRFKFRRYSSSPIAWTYFDDYGYNHPKIAIEIHYEIIDPNYPLEDSRERIIQKVITPTLDYRKYENNPGCSPY